MTTTTLSRKIRRAEQKFDSKIMDAFLTLYSQDPNAALKWCFEKFGKEKFEYALKLWIETETAQRAMVYAIRRCTHKEVRL